MQCHEGQPETPSPAGNSTSYWFEDGNVILHAGPQSFRVHMSLLARHSTFFRDLFKLPQPSSEMLDGCAVVQMHDVPGDVEILLSALYDGCGMSLAADKCLPFSTIACLIRLGHKYQIEQILAGAISRLKTCFPLSYYDSPTLRERRSPYMNFEDKDAITAVNLARLTQSDTVLPPALYTCALLPNDLLLNGVARPDGTLERLSPEDLIRCLNGRQALLAAARERFSWLYRQPKINVSIECIDKEECTANLESMAKEIVQIGLVANINVLDPIGDEVEQGELCDNCWKMVQDEDDDSRGAIWYRLHEYMGVTITYQNLRGVQYTLTGPL